MTTRVRIKKAYLPKGWSDREYNARHLTGDIYKIGQKAFDMYRLIPIASTNDQPTTHFIRKMS